LRAGITVIFVKLPAPIIPKIAEEGRVENTFTGTACIKSLMKIYSYNNPHYESAAQKFDDSWPIQFLQGYSNFYEKEFSNYVPMFLTGDFNGEIAIEKEFVSLNRVASLSDSFDVINPPLTEKERITHSYFPKDGRPKWAQLDAVMVNEAATKFVNAAKVPHYHDENGTEIPVPQSYDELHKTQPSDHYPVHVELDFKKLVH
jgi:exonuclease III